MQAFREILRSHFPGAMGDREYVERTVGLLEPLGFTGDNAIACASTCRDEICRSVREWIHDAWGESFNFSSLGGMLTLGRTGFDAFHAHAPRAYERRRHVYYAMPHLGVGPNGDLGAVTRYGIPEGSRACGALFAFAAELADGRVDLTHDLGDIEQSLLKMRLVKLMKWGDSPDPIELVKIAEQASREDLEAGIAATVDTAEVDYAVFTGVQIHGPERVDSIWPVAAYAVLEGRRQELELA